MTSHDDRPPDDPAPRLPRPRQAAAPACSVPEAVEFTEEAGMHLFVATSFSGGRRRSIPLPRNFSLEQVLKGQRSR